VAATSAKKPGKSPAKKPANVVLAWEDDPMALPAITPIQRPVPNLADRVLAVRISDARPAPRIYSRGTREFRYWAAAEALRRAADFWAGIVPAGFSWQVGAELPVVLEAGVDLNAFYSRGFGGDPPGLSFFLETVGGVTFYSGESPEVSCHELGHALLDGLKPELFEVPFAEAAAFHESFGDISAILSVLQLPSMRVDAIATTGGRIYRNSRLSRVAEQLGFAIRQNHPDAVDGDSLRNAVNTFFYRDPQQLPPRAPASLLSSEPHSFSRVFTGAFLEILAGIFLAQSAPGRPGGEQQLLAATRIAAELLVAAVVASPVVPAYYAQVAAHFLTVDAAKFDKQYRDVVKGAFVRRGILSLEAASSGVTEAKTPSAARALSAAPTARQRRTEMMAVPARHLGRATLLVEAPAAAPRFAVAAAAPSFGELQAPSRAEAIRSFVEDLFRRGRVDMGGHGDHDARVSQPQLKKTHELVATDGGVRLRRLKFDCGFDAGC
jgi:hypothetical protein